MDAETHRPAWKKLLAFGIIYFVWGSTFYAIQVGVREVPPFLLTATRFLIAGAALFGWTRALAERVWHCCHHSGKRGALSRPHD